MTFWEWLVGVLVSEDARAIYNRLGQIITVLSAIFAFINSRQAKNALLAEKRQRSRKGEVEYSVTYRHEAGIYRLGKLFVRPINSLFTNPERERLFRNSGNENRQAIVSAANGPENVGLQDTGDPGENKFFSLTHANMIYEMIRLLTLLHAAGVQCRLTKFLLAFRYDTYSTNDKVDGYQTGRGMLFPLDDVIAAGEDPSFFDTNTTEIKYQRDRLYHMKEVYQVWTSKKESDKWRVVELVIPVPEVLFACDQFESLAKAATSLNAAVAKAQETITLLRQLGGELSESRLEELANTAAEKAVGNVSEKMRRAFEG